MQINDKPPRRVRVERGIYKSPATGRLEIMYTDEAGRQRWQTISGDLAEARLARAEARLGYARDGGRLRARWTFEQVGEEWLRAQTHLRPRTARHYASALDRHLYPRFGARRIATIDEDAIARLIVELRAQGLSGWTIRSVLVPLGRVLGYAARRRLIQDNPLRRLDRSERPRVIRREMRILDSQEIEALLGAAPAGYRTLLATAVFTGLRQGELLGLRWRDLDLEHGLVHVRWQLDRGSGGYVEPKTPHALRDVVLMPSLAVLLQEHKQRASYSGPADPVFSNVTGRPLQPRNVVRSGLAVAVAGANLEADGQPHLRFHDLRHTYASLLVAQGLNVIFVSRQLGHSTPSFTLDVYGGLFDRAEHARRAADELEHSFGQLLRPPTAAAENGADSS